MAVTMTSDSERITAACVLSVVGAAYFMFRDKL